MKNIPENLVQGSQKQDGRRFQLSKSLNRWLELRNDCWKPEISSVKKVKKVKNPWAYFGMWFFWQSLFFSDLKPFSNFPNFYTIEDKKKPKAYLDSPRPQLLLIKFPKSSCQSIFRKFRKTSMLVPLVPWVEWWSWIFYMTPGSIFFNSQYFIKIVIYRLVRVPFIIYSYF